MKKILFILILIFVSESICFSQRIFFGDSLIVSSKDKFIGKSDYYYNHYTNSNDSICFFDRKSDVMLKKTLNITAPIDSNGLITGKVIGKIEDKIYFEVDYEKGVSNGYFILYENNKDTSYVAPIYKGLKNGIAKEIFNDSCFINSNFVMGIQCGNVIEKNGKNLIYFCNYQDNEKNGTEFVGHDCCGNLKSCLVYNKGKVVDGEYHLFSVDGFITHTAFFKNGFIQKEIRYNIDGTILKISERNN
jgi:hypothetical protein